MLMMFIVSLVGFSQSSPVFQDHYTEDEKVRSRQWDGYSSYIFSRLLHDSKCFPTFPEQRSAIIDFGQN